MRLKANIAIHFIFPSFIYTLGTTVSSNMAWSALSKTIDSTSRHPCQTFRQQCNRLQRLELLIGHLEIMSAYTYNQQNTPKLKAIFINKRMNTVKANTTQIWLLTAHLLQIFMESLWKEFL